jgi:hypothetical protein
LIFTSDAQQCKAYVEIAINNDEPLQTIWDPMREIKRGERGGHIPKLINLHLLCHYSTFSQILKMKLKLEFQDLFNY